MDGYRVQYHLFTLSECAQDRHGHIVLFLRGVDVSARVGRIVFGEDVVVA